MFLSQPQNKASEEFLSSCINEHVSCEPQRVSGVVAKDLINLNVNDHRGNALCCWIVLIMFVLQVKDPYNPCEEFL